MKSPLAAALLSAGAAYVGALWQEHSFEPQFKSFNAEGMRQVEGWRFGGSAEINENFLRLTPDRQSKRGFIWNTNRVEAERSEFWSATLRFRTSGQGKRLFGDGIAFWATSSPSHRDGGLLGFTDSFHGFGIVLDTFVNSEPGHVHKDIQIVSSDGAAPVKLDDKPVGCDADFRYWEGRDDFAVTNHSALRVRYGGGRVSVWIDARGSGQWAPCITDAQIAPPSGWNKEGLWIGLSASTGDLADNHDVLSLHLGPEDEPAPVPLALAGSSASLPPFESSGDPRLDASISSAMSREAALLADRLTFVQHSLEHQLSAISDSLRSALKRLQEQEDASAKRIDELERKIREKVEDKVNKQVDSKLDEGVASRLAKLEGMVAAAVNNNLDSRMKSDVMPELESRVRSMQASAAGSSMYIYAAIAAMAAVMCVLSCFAYVKYRKLSKMHLL